MASSRDRLLLFLAEGLGSGRLRPGPGTWGSVVGVAWFALLLVPGNPVWFTVGNLLGIAAAVWASGEAERILGRHDPGSVVIDEIVAMPLCFAVPLGVLAGGSAGHFPNLGEFLRLAPTWWIPAGFAAFRLFDIWKPWPVRAIQKLPGGWGIVADDLLAAVWVDVLFLLLPR